MTVELARRLLHRMHAYYDDVEPERRSHIGRHVGNWRKTGRLVDVRPALKRH